MDINKVTNLDSVTVKRNPISDNELSCKNFVDDPIGGSTIVRFNQTLENNLKVSVGNDTYNLTKYGKKETTDTTITEFPNTRGYLLQQWNTKCNDKNNNNTNFIRSSKTSSPTGDSEANSPPPIGKSFLYIETSSSNHGSGIIFVSFDRTDIVQISINTFYYERFSILNNEAKKSIGTFGSLLLLNDNTWSTRYNIPKSYRYSNSSTQWTLVNLNFTIEIYGNKLIYDQIDTPHADMCFSNITITHSV